MTLTESDVEQVALGWLGWLGGLGWRIAHGPDIGPDGPDSERADYSQVLRLMPPQFPFWCRQGCPKAGSKFRG